MTSNLQIAIRNALLYRASADTKSKFTGLGKGEKKILREDAECIVATVMAILAAKKTREDIVLSDGTRIEVGAYPTIGTGLAIAMNWNGEAYFSKSDMDRPERSFIGWSIPEYVKDTETYTVDGKPKTMEAAGQVVTPEKLEQLINDYNKNQGSADDKKLVKGSNVDKSHILFSEFAYVCSKTGVLKELTSDTKTIGLEFASLFQPKLTFVHDFGKLAEEATDTQIAKWLC